MSEERKQWTTEEVINLIQALREHPNLWNPTNKNYKNRLKKVDTLKEIALLFGTTSHEIERKIKNVVSQYRRERRNYKTKKSETGHAFKAKWFGYNAMSFLRDKHKAKKQTQIGVDIQDSDSSDEIDEDVEDIQSDTQSTTVLKIESDSETEESQLNEEDTTVQVYMSNPFVEKVTTTDKVYKNPRVEEVKSTQETHNQRSQQQHVFGKCSSKIKICNDDDKGEIMQIFEMMKSIVEKREALTPGRDEYDIFGELVAHNIRKLQTEYSKVTVQHHINNLLYEARLGNYDLPQNL